MSFFVLKNKAVIRSTSFERLPMRFFSRQKVFKVFHNDIARYDAQDKLNDTKLYALYEQTFSFLYIKTLCAGYLYALSLLFRQQRFRSFLCANRANRIDHFKTQKWLDVKRQPVRYEHKQSNRMLCRSYRTAYETTIVSEYFEFIVDWLLQNWTIFIEELFQRVYPNILHYFGRVVEGERHGRMIYILKRS